MDTNTLFITANRKKYRFDSNRGPLTTEQLFELPMTSKSGFDLDTVAKEVNRQLKAQTEDSFVEVKRNDLRDELTNKLEVVKTVISWKQAEATKAQQAVAKSAERQKLLTALEAVKSRKLEGATEEELLKQLEALEA